MPLLFLAIPLWGYITGATAVGALGGYFGTKLNKKSSSSVSVEKTVTSEQP